MLSEAFTIILLTLPIVSLASWETTRKLSEVAKVPSTKTSARSCPSCADKDCDVDYDKNSFPIVELFFVGLAVAGVAFILFGGSKGHYKGHEYEPPPPPPPTMKYPQMPQYNLPPSSVSTYGSRNGRSFGGALSSQDYLTAELRQPKSRRRSRL